MRHRVTAGSSFKIAESVDGDGALRLRLTGELDLASADRLRTRLQQLCEAGRQARLDLSGLRFIDATGLHALIAGLQAGRAGGLDLFEVATPLSAAAARLVELVGLGPLLWPSEAP